MPSPSKPNKGKGKAIPKTTEQLRKEANGARNVAMDALGTAQLTEAYNKMLGGNAMTSDAIERQQRASQANKVAQQKELASAKSRYADADKAMKKLKSTTPTAQQTQVRAEWASAKKHLENLQSNMLP